VRIHDLAASGVGRGPGDLTFGVRAYTQSGENGGPEAPLRHPFLPFGEPATRALFPPMPAPAPL